MHLEERNDKTVRQCVREVSGVKNRPRASDDDSSLSGVEAAVSHRGVTRSHRKCNMNPKGEEVMQV